MASESEVELSVHEVFKTKGVPRHTYVNRAKGKLERDLRTAFLDSGTVVVLSGPSKAGKTVLSRKVAANLGRERIEIPCNYGLDSVAIWKTALEKLDFERLSRRVSKSGRSIEGAAEIEGGLGWRWLAGVIGKAKLGLSKNSSEEEAREKILSDPGPGHAIPALQSLPLMLILENFHYLSESTKKVLFQQWRELTDEEVSSVFLGTSHRVFDLISANNDLAGRVTHLPITGWELEELQAIAIKGFRLLKVQPSREIVIELCRQAVGVPLLMQALCKRLLVNAGIDRATDENRRIRLSAHDAYAAFCDEAKMQYAALFDPLIDRLEGRGPNCH